MEPPDYFSGGPAIDSLDALPTKRHSRDKNSEKSVVRRFIKLEVLNARQLDRIIFLNLVVLGVCVLHAVIVSILANTVFLHGENLTLPFYNRTIRVRREIFPNSLRILEDSLRLVLSAVSIIAALSYTIRIVRNRKHSPVTREQVWASVLLIATAMYLSPIAPLLRIHDGILNGGNPERQWRRHFWVRLIRQINVELYYFFFALSTLFYTWATLHTYGILDDRKLGWRFYLPKIVPLLLYHGGRVFSVHGLRVIPTMFMFGQPFYMLKDWGQYNLWRTGPIIIVAVITLVEFGLLIAIVRRGVKSSRILRNSDYIKHRAKIVGFRFFIFQNVLYHSWAIIFRIVFKLTLPNYDRLVFLKHTSDPVTLAPHRSPWVSFNDRRYSFGSDLVVLAYAITSAYVNLPADSVGWRGWFVSSGDIADADEDRATPITYSSRESMSESSGSDAGPPSPRDSDLFREHHMCFVMETHASLFNLSWMVYDWGTRKHRRVENLMGNSTMRQAFQLSIAAHIKDEATDTHVLVIEGDDRIILAFRGTNSLQNLKTDVKIRYTPLSRTMPTLTGSADTDMISSRDWRRAKLHSGFAEAYVAVSGRLLEEVLHLLDNKFRPIFLTGHSLGGALATLCSLDLRASIPSLDEGTLMVSTFGSPKCGNRAWRNVYDAHVPIHWRVKMAPDIVSMLPKFGYTHVGRNVIFTTSGRMLLDPDSLEHRLWSQEGASVMHHKKSAYFLALHAFCQLYHVDRFKPDLWPYPVTDAEVKKWERACNVKLRIKKVVKEPASDSALLYDVANDEDTFVGFGSGEISNDGGMASV